MLVDVGFVSCGELPSGAAAQEKKDQQNRNGNSDEP
jgi:hypothetical protein